MECESDEFLTGAYFNGSHEEILKSAKVMFECAPFLKGEDMIIYRVAKSLGLSVQLKAICRRSGGSEDFVVPRFHHQCQEFRFPEMFKDKAKLAFVFGHVESAENIRWCVLTEERKVPLLSTIHVDGDDVEEATAIVYYQSAALLIEVPKFTSGRGFPVASAQIVLSCIEQEVGNVEAKIETIIEDNDRSTGKTHMLLKNKHTELVTERSQLMCMVPPSKKAKK